MSSITAHNNRSLDLIAFLGHDQFVIDDTSLMEVDKANEKEEPATNSTCERRKLKTRLNSNLLA